MRRREFIAGLGGAVAWPLAARAQPWSLPAIAFITGAVDASATDASTRFTAAFRNGLGETGYIDGHNVTIKYRQRAAPLVADVVHRRVAVIASVGVLLAAKAATTTIPIVFGVSEDPVKLGLGASLARPGSNATGVNFFNQEVTAKRLGLLHELVPRATRLAILNNPSIGPVAESASVGVQQAAGTNAWRTSLGQDQRWQPIASPGARTAASSEIDLGRLDLETEPAPASDRCCADTRRETPASARPTGFPLAHVGAVDCVALRRHVIDAQCHEIASAQFAVDRQVEEG
jgi:hypothetical protein